MIQYANVLKSNNNDGYTHVFREAVESLRNTCNVNALNGAQDLYGDPIAFAKYTNKLVEGFEPEQAEQIKKLLDNNRRQVLSEASLAGIPPITALNAPTLVKMWAKSGLKNVIPTQVTDKPVFSVLSNHPYMIADDGTKIELPEGLFEGGDRTNRRRNAVGNKEAYVITIAMEHLKAGIDVADSANESKITFVKALAGAKTTTTKTLQARLVEDELDYVKVLYANEDAEGKNDGSSKKHGIITFKEKNGKRDSRQSLGRKFYFQVGAAGAEDSALTDVLGHVDLAERELQFLSANDTEVTSLTFEIGVASTQHRRSTEVSFEVRRRDFEIPTGEHFEVNLPLEFINDMYALYQIDSAAVATETLSNVINQKLEQEIDEFLGEYVTDGQKEFEAGKKEKDYKRVAYHKVFDVHPAGQFAMIPKDYLSELRRVIDYLANRIKTDSYFYQGYFVIYGNPVDIALIPNVDWTFNSASDNVNGINTNFSIGAMSGANKYVIVGSDLLPMGELRMIMCPTVDDYKTFMYYPYTFNIVNNYLNANGKNTMPNLMMTKRHTFGDFMNLSASITIKNNDGTIFDSTLAVNKA